MIIVKVDFDRDYFRYVIDKMNDYYDDYYINELRSRANSVKIIYSENILITTTLALLDS